MLALKTSTFLSRMQNEIQLHDLKKLRQSNDDLIEGDSEIRVIKRPQDHVRNTTTCNDISKSSAVANI